jgi:large repetitive protein
VLDANPGDAPGLTYLWSTGETTETITVSQTAIFDVTITDAQGCTTDGSFITSDNRPIVQFGPDLTVCQNTPIFPLDAQNPGATYQWFINGVVTPNTSQTQTVDTSTPTVTPDVYVVQVTDPVTTCFRRDTVAYDVKESPAFTATPGAPIACGAATGQITIDITSPATGLFSYFVSGPGGSFSDFDRTATEPPIVVPGLSAGTYGVTVSDQVSGCATINTVAIDNNAFTVSATPVGACDPITLSVDITGTPGPIVFPVSYRVINNSTAQVVDQGSNIGAEPINTTLALPSNNQQYVVEITSSDGGTGSPTNCVATSPPVTVNEAASVAATFTTNTFAKPI